MAILLVHAKHVIPCEWADREEVFKCTYNTLLYPYIVRCFHRQQNKSNTCASLLTTGVTWKFI